MSEPTTPRSPSPPRREPTPSGPGVDPRSIRIPRWLWAAILVGLLVWNGLLIFTPMSAPSVDVPYSTFLAQVRADNVAQVTLSGQAVDGTFRSAIQFPPVTPSSAPTASAPSPTASSDALPRQCRM